MKILNQLERLQQLDHLIKNQTTGKPEDIAKKSGVSRSHL